MTNILQVKVLLRKELSQISQNNLTSLEAMTMSYLFYVPRT